MKNYMLKRILMSILSFFIVVGVVMFLTYSCIDSEKIFQNDGAVKKFNGNERTMYKIGKLAEYGYLEYETVNDYLTNKYKEKDGDDYQQDSGFQAAIAAVTSDASYLKDDKVYTYSRNEDLVDFITTYKNKKYTVVYLPETKNADGKTAAVLYAKKDISVFVRFFKYFANFFSVETINDVKDENLTDRYIRWEWDKRSNMPALVGSGTKHKYLIYFDNVFPFIHQNLIHLNLGLSTVDYAGTDVTDVITSATTPLKIDQQYPVDIEAGNNVYHNTSVDFHSVTYSSTITAADEEIYGVGEHYVVSKTYYDGLTKIGNSFVIGIISSAIAYLFGLPLGILIARKKDKLADKIGNVYIIFIMAVPSLAYIFIFAAIGTTLFGLPYKFANATIPILGYILPTISLALPSIGSLMKWMRRYMIDQENSDYVKFARSQGLSEGEIFSKHIARNAMIYLVQGIPGTILGALTGAIITERVYSVPGIGNLLTDSLNSYDNGVIVACTVFYTFISIVSLILGDLLLQKYDPRVSLSGKGA